MGYIRTVQKGYLVQRIVTTKDKQLTVAKVWWVSFSKCYPEILLRVSEPLGNVQSLCTTSDVIEIYVDLLEHPEI